MSTSISSEAITTDRQIDDRCSLIREIFTKKFRHSFSILAERKKVRRIIYIPAAYFYNIIYRTRLISMEKK